MAKNVSLKRNFLLNLIIQMLTVIAPLVTAPYLSRVLHEEGNGIYSYSYSIITYFVLAANLGFNIYGQREIARNRDNKELRDKIFCEIIFAKGVTSIISSIILFLLVGTIGFGSDYNRIIAVLSILVVSCIFDVNFYFQGIEDFLSIVIRTIIIKFVGTVFIFIFVKNENDIWIYALCIAASTIGANIVMWPSIFKNVKFYLVKSKDIIKHIKPSILVFIPTLAVTIYSVFDKTMIGLFSNNPKYDNGCYEQAYKINSAALILITVISPILIPRNSYDYKNGNMDSFNKHVDFACRYVWLLGLPMIVGFMVLSPNLSRWYLGKGYDEVPLMLKIMSIRFLFSGFGVVLGDQIFIAIGKEKFSTIATMIGACVNVILNYFFIKKWGATGAAVSTSICEIVVTTILLIIAVKSKFISFKKLILMPWKYIIATTAMFIVIYPMQFYWKEYSIWSFLIITACGSLTYGIILLLIRDKFALGLLNKVLCLVHLKTEIIDNEKFESDEIESNIINENNIKEEEHNEND